MTLDEAITAKRAELAANGWIINPDGTAHKNGVTVEIVAEDRPVLSSGFGPTLPVAEAVEV